MFSHEDGPDGVVNVSISSSAQQLPETHLGLLAGGLAVAAHRSLKHEFKPNIGTFQYILVF